MGSHLSPIQNRNRLSPFTQPLSAEPSEDRDKGLPSTPPLAPVQKSNLWQRRHAHQTALEVKQPATKWADCFKWAAKTRRAARSPGENLEDQLNQQQEALKQAIRSFPSSQDQEKCQQWRRKQQQTIDRHADLACQYRAKHDRLKNQVKMCLQSMESLKQDVEQYKKECKKCNIVLSKDQRSYEYWQARCVEAYSRYSRDSQEAYAACLFYQEDVARRKLLLDYMRIVQAMKTLLEGSQLAVLSLQTKKTALHLIGRIISCAMRSTFLDLQDIFRNRSILRDNFVKLGKILSPYGKSFPNYGSPLALSMYGMAQDFTYV